MFRRNIRAALVTGGATLGLSLASATPAAAQGSEVEMLRNQVRDLLARIERLEKGAGVPATPTAAPAPAIAPGNPKVKVTFGGWINRAMVYADNGPREDFMFVDNNGASSRINLSATGQVTDALSLGAVVELEAISNNSRTLDIDTNSTALSFNERKIEGWAEIKDLGRVWLGQGDMATQAVAEVDLSGTANLGLYSDIGATFGGITFAPTAAAAAAGPSVDAAFRNFDGPGNARDDRLRFDTATIAGFTAMAAVSHNDTWDAAVRYAGKFGDTSVSAALGYADISRKAAGLVTGVAPTGGLAGADTVLSGSVSARLAGGVNATVAVGQQDFRTAGRDTAGYWYAKLGYIAKFTPIGDTAFAIDYYDGSDIFANGSESTAYGATVVQQLTAINSEVYVAVRNHEAEAPGVDLDDVLAVMTGARVRF